MTASIAPLADLAKRVGGARVKVVSLLPPGASEHTWEPSPRDATRVAGTHLFFKVGLGFELWAEKLLAASGAAYVTVDASEEVDLIFGGGSGVSETAEAGGLAHPHDSLGDREGVNPHYWLDPVAMKGAVARLGAALAGLDPERAEAYRQRVESTLGELDALDAEIRRRTQSLTSRKMLTFHSAWEYFARRYGLEVVASIEESAGKDPGPRHIGRLVRLVREEGIRAVFAEPQYPPKAAEVIAAECGIPVRILDPLGGETIPGRGDYFSLLRYNTAVLEDTLR